MAAGCPGAYHTPHGLSNPEVSSPSRKVARACKASARPDTLRASITSSRTRSSHRLNSYSPSSDCLPSGLALRGSACSPESLPCSQAAGELALALGGESSWGRVSKRVA